MPEQLQPSIPFIVRIKSTHAMGLGFCVDDSHVITCAHVVKDVLSLDDCPDEAPKSKVTVEFPYANGAIRKASVLAWHPWVSDGDRVNDIAVLALDAPKPETIPAAVLLRSETLFGHPFWAFGYTASSPNGIWSHGEMCPTLPNGRLQIENPKDKGVAIEHGFSGTPVWDEDLHGVVGMIAEALLRQTATGAVKGEGIAFVIPVGVLVEAWPDLERIAWPESKEEGARQVYTMLNEGNTLYNLGRYEEALDYYDEALDIDSHYARAWKNKGLSLCRLGRYEEALACFDKALKIDPLNADVWDNKGVAASESSYEDEAIFYYNKALEIDPHHVSAQKHKISALKKLGHN